MLSEFDAAAVRRLRRERLEREPGAFAESLEEHDAMPLETIAMRLRRSSGDYFIVGSFDESDALTGMAGFFRNSGPKTRHKGTIWGVYVTGSARGQGAGRAMLEALIARAREQSGLEQIQLGVSTVQIAARRLYGSLGFESFGCERHALKVDGEYVDEEHMVLWLKRLD